MSTSRLTNTTAETDIGTLLAGDKVYFIPFFQRPYRWTSSKLRQFEKDLLSLVDGINDVHFMGAVITHGLTSNPSDPKPYELIDGQQRLTTLYLYLCAVVKTYLDQDDLAGAQKIFLKYLVITVGAYAGSNLKLQSSREDQGAMNGVIREVLGSKKFEEHLQGFKFKPLPNAQVQNNRITATFKAAKAFLRSETKEAGIERLHQIYAQLVQSLTVVQIEILDPTNGPKIFDSLNSGQQPMTIGDLVRNDVFAKTAASDPEAAGEIDANHWGPFYSKFKVDGKDSFDEYFFPFGLIFDPNLRKSEVYAALKDHWKQEDPEDVIVELERYQAPFLDLKFGTNATGLPKSERKQFRRFFEMGAPTSIYPFLMQLGGAIRDERISLLNARETMAVLDSFLTRRALCGKEPTGLHAVFKGLWSEVGEEPTAIEVSRRISSHKTVEWPTDHDVRSAVKSRPLYKTSVDKYVIMQYDESLGGDDVSGLNMWIEHVLPQSQTAAAWQHFTSAEHQGYVDLFANLIPLTAEMNNSLQANSYSSKSSVYKGGSAFRSAREFADQHEAWTPQLLLDRGESLAEWCVSRWPHGRYSS